MAIIRNLVVKIAADISSLSKGLQTAQKQIQKVASSFTRAGTKLTAGVTAPLVALGASAINISKSFEQSMANAASVAMATGDELQAMTDLAREMGAKTVFSASEAADALYYMASAGYKLDEMTQSIEATLNLASATQSDLAFTTDTVVAALNQFQLGAAGAERVANLYAAAIGASQADMEKLAFSMNYVGPVANSLGWEIEEVVGALSVLYDAGYDGSMAGTSLRQSLVALMNPTSAAQKVFDDLGISLEQLDPTSNDLASILDTLSNAGMTTAQAMEVFGARAGPGMLSLLAAGGDAVRDMTEAITGTNAANDMAAMQIGVGGGGSPIRGYPHPNHPRTATKIHFAAHKQADEFERRNEKKYSGYCAPCSGDRAAPACGRKIDFKRWNDHQTWVAIVLEDGAHHCSYRRCRGGD